MVTEQVTFFVAQDLMPGAQMLDTGEDIKVHRVPLQQVSIFLDACSARGVKIDHKIFVGLYFARCAGWPPPHGCSGAVAAGLLRRAPFILAAWTRNCRRLRGQRYA